MLIYIYSILYVILTLKSRRKILKIFFLAVTRLLLEKKKLYFSYFLHNFSKNGHNLWRHQCYSCNFETFFYQFFCNMTEYDCAKFCAKFHVKSIFLWGFTQGGRGHYVPPPPPRAWPYKNTAGQIGLTVMLLEARTNNLLTPWEEASRGNLARLLLSKSLVSIFVWYSFQ